MVFDQRRATLDPVACVAIQRTLDIAHFGPVNMTTNDTLMTPASCFVCHRHFELGDVVKDLLDLVFQIGGERPVG